MTRWFTSDLHLGDPWAAKMRYCGDDVEMHSMWLAARWDAVVAPDDEVWLIGDIVVDMAFPQFHEWLTDRPGVKKLVLGNWDDAWPRETWKAAGFSEVRSVCQLVLSDGTEAKLSHWPGDAECGVRIHGHTHRRVKSSMTENGTLLLHVGWDAWRRMVPEKDLIELIEKERGDGDEDG